MTNPLLRLSSVLLLGSAFVAAPLGLTGGADLGYPSAWAEKGGNGGGKGGGSSNAGGGGGGAGASNANDNSNFSTQKSKAGRPVVVPVSAAPADAPNSKGKLASALGRWNAAKPIDHPAVQAHIRNGNFKGTIGMVAAYLVAQQAMDELELAVPPALPADSMLPAPTSFEEALALANLILAPADPDNPTPVIYSPEETAWATSLLTTYGNALDDLQAAEANMEKYSNRGDWADIRAAVRTKMGLDPLDNDLLPST